MIFISLGTQNFQLNRLLKKIDVLISEGKINDSVFAQIGYSDYLPINYGYKRFIDNNSFNDYIKKSSLVITHGGVGNIITALNYGKKIIVVPRIKKFNEHVDDHQVQIARAFYDNGHTLVCKDLKNLAKIISNSKEFVPKRYISHRTAYIEFIKKIITDK
ncbi:PssE/Cps14G family polysaccharide biosynthesis glycosyltransferase [Lactiplantibacillus plantarum]|uniref:PssE/Cps14G family polysaccharide biosynthesis glycosyltransferase n=1 Tax=Lactiplantibacillus plantarum TaxID=1590 RepID=UPI00155A9D1E|nr:PssE/Cps14G family polysaccharide biosynthesis glycosyltransferase [Lactiplantibacillus plantarum]